MKIANEVCKGLASLDWIFHIVIGSSPHILGTPYCMTFAVKFPHE